MNAMEQKVYDYIKANKPEKQKDIALGIPMDAGLVSKALQSLQMNGKVDYKPAKFVAR